MILTTVDFLSTDLQRDRHLRLPICQEPDSRTKLFSPIIIRETICRVGGSKEVRGPET